MSIDRFSAAAIRVGTNPAIFRRRRRIVLLAVLVLAVIASSAQAHTAAATATCKSVTFNWTMFAASGSGNGALNTPRWTITFKPTSGPSVTTSGKASFRGSSSSLTVTVPSGNGVVTVSSSWSAAETRDSNSGAWSQNLTIWNCPVQVNPAQQEGPVVLGESVTGPRVVTTASPICIRSAPALRGVAETVRTSLTVHVAAPGVKSVTFFLDGRKLATVTRPSRRRFSMAIDARRLSYGLHRLRANVKLRDSYCSSAIAVARFIRVKAVSIPPKFAG